MTDNNSTVWLGGPTTSIINLDGSKSITIDLSGAAVLNQMTHLGYKNWDCGCKRNAATAVMTRNYPRDDDDDGTRPGLLMRRMKELEQSLITGS